MGKVKSVGSGDHAVVCLHGWFGSADGWGFLPDVVDRARFTYWFPEMRGYGARRDEVGDYSMKEYAADALAMADEIGLDRFSVVGHSMGGKAAASLLAQAPDRVRALVGVNPVAPAPVPLDEDGRGLFFGAPESDDNRRAIIDFTTGGRNSAAWVDDMVAFSRAGSTPGGVRRRGPVLGGRRLPRRRRSPRDADRLPGGGDRPGPVGRGDAPELDADLPERHARRARRLRSLPDVRDTGRVGDPDRGIPRRQVRLPGQGWVMLATSRASSSCCSVRSPRSTYPISRTTCLMVFSSASAVLATLAAFS